jgi:hypothetical protein
MPRPCSHQLDIYHPQPITIYDAPEDTIDYSVSTDPDHPFPYLLAPSQYAEQQIDPILCTATIGTVSVGVIDPAVIEGNQTTGWMTAKIFDLMGRRCRLRRWVDDDIGWVVIADGPAGVPSLDTTYAAYRWAIRDSRDIERKLTAFYNGGVASICPRGAVYGFGKHFKGTSDETVQWLLPPTLDNPLVAPFSVEVLPVGGGVNYTVGIINFSALVSGSADDKRRVRIDDPGWAACQMVQIDQDTWAVPGVDFVWRVIGDTVWNISRPTVPDSFRQAIIGSTDIPNPDDPTKLTKALDFVTLFLESSGVPPGFPTGSCNVEFVLRYRDQATTDYPYYIDAPLGEVLKNAYDGRYTLVPIDGITGILYDPGSLDARASVFLSRVLYDQSAFDAMPQRVLYRATSTVPDVRAWTETNLYGPSGYIPALNKNAEISPIVRTRPGGIDSNLIEDAVVEPTPNWNMGETTVSEVQYTWERYFIPQPFANIATDPDGLATRDVELDFDDEYDAYRYGDNPEVYDASAFSAVGDVNGLALAGTPEQASLFAQAASFDVLSRFHAGAQTIKLNVLRSIIPSARVGGWVPWNLSWMPDRNTGLRGSIVPAAQIVAIEDDDCTWRLITLIEDGGLGSVAGQPGFVTNVREIGDDPTAGFTSGIVELSDVEH